MKSSKMLLAAAVGCAAFAAWYYCRNDEIVYVHKATKESPPRPSVETPATPAISPVTPVAVTTTSLRVPVSGLPDLPVTVTHRPSAVGRGGVGVVQNNGTAYLRLSATYKNVTNGRTNTVNIEVAPGATTELGWLEKCPFAAGDTLTLSHPNFKPRTWEF